MLQLERAALDAAAAASAIAGDVAAFSAALVAEAAENDDVLDAASALAYCGDRCLELGDLVPEHIRRVVLAACAERIRRW